MFVYKSLLILATTISFVSCGHAPDTAPDLPDGWCNLEFGSPTRSTGECICKISCVGKGCKREHGLSWYEYKACPTCECVAAAAAKTTAATAAVPPKPSNAESVRQEGNSRDSMAPRDTEPPEQEEEEEEEETFNFIDWLDENSDKLFAGVVSFFVFGILLIFLLGAAAPIENLNEKKEK
jgi:hypothetical protein